MKKKFLFLFSLLFLFPIAQVHCAGLIDTLSKSAGLKGDKKKLVAFGVVGRVEQQLATFKKAKEKLDKQTKEFSDNLKKRMTLTTASINEVNAQIVRDPVKQEPASFFNQKLSLLNEIYQALSDTKSSREQQLFLLEKNIQILEEYLKEPSLPDYRKEYRDLKKIYSFTDFQDLYQMILEQEKRIKSLEEQQKNAQIEQENREQAALITSEDYIKKKKELEDFIKDPAKASTPGFMFAFNQVQKEELLKLQEQLYEIKNTLDEFRVKETKYKVNLIENKIFIEKIKLDILNKAARNIKPTIRIIESDIAKDKAKLEQEKRTLFAKRKPIREKIEAITKENANKLKQLQSYSKQYDIPLDIQLDQWEEEPKTTEEYRNILKTGSLNEYIRRNNREKILLEAQMSLEDEKLYKKKIQTEIKESFYKIKNKKFTTEEEINKEARKFNSYLSEIKAKIAETKEQKKSAEDSLVIKRRALENLNAIGSNLAKEKARIKPVNFTLFANLLKNAKIMINQQIKLLLNIINIYDSIIEINENTYKNVEFILSELETASLWLRPAYAIKWEEIKNIAPELSNFFNDIKIYIVQFSFVNLFDTIKLAFPTTLSFILLLIKLLIIILLLLLFRIYVPPLHSKLIQLSREHQGTRFFTLVAAFIIEFIVTYFISISIWIILFWMMQLEAVPDHIKILFYLLSIPYFVYLANRLLRYLATFNERHAYILFSKTFQKRLMITLSIILYATVIIFLFRKAFILNILYYKSALPSILLALYIIILQISLLPLLVKEQILSIIPTKNRMWRWIHVQVNKFYYLILALFIAIIILSNPYIGFSKLVGYIAIRVVITGILIKGLFWLHGLIKKASLKLFFTTDEEIVQARFTYGKTTYGLSVILSFAFLVAIGLLIGAYIWGWDISLTSLYENWFDKEILTGDESKPITLISFFKLFSFVFAGFIVAYSINRFVLRKIFDLLLVNPGVQHAIKSIMKYIIITTFLIIGFQHIHLSRLVTYLVVTLGFSIGWILKDPLSDFAYYFVLLIQRPLKIGDYILIDNEVQGVVRKITPRSVVIRKKNSETILVPNSKIISNPIFNWNYVSGFVAFDDIMITIAYDQDPTRVKEILTQVLDKHPNVLKSPKPIVRLENFGEYGYIFLIRGFLSSHYTLDKWDIASDIRLSLVKALTDNNIKIAVPVRMMLPTKTATQQGQVLEPKEEEK